MLHRIFLPLILSILGLGFWISPNFKEIAAGVAIFLFGMLSLEEGFNAFTGGTLERLLRRATSNRFKSLAFGLFSTALMQSSSLVSIIAISFLSAGLITLSAGIGIVFGANLGTTTGAWLIAGFGLKVSLDAYAMPILVFGTVMLFQRSQQLKGIGYVLVGLGFLFLGIHHMKEGFDTFRDTIDLTQYALTGYTGVFLFALIGVFATVVMQSSHATLVLIITALAAQQITYENALALAIGANVGTTVTAILGALTANTSGKRLAAAHLVFNVATGLISIGFIYQLVDLVDRMAVITGIGTDDYTLKLAVFHTIFNLIGVFVMFPLIGLLVRALEHALPDRLPDVDQPRYLSSASAEFPDSATEAVRNETLRVFNAATRVIVTALDIKRLTTDQQSHLNVTRGEPAELETRDVDVLYERHIKTIYSAIVAFISETAFSRRDEQAASLQWLREANAYIVEAVKDTKHLQKNLQPYVLSTNADIKQAYETLRENIADILNALQTLEHDAGGVMDMLALDALSLEIDKQRSDMTGQMTRLIGQHRISPQMGSSLLNDSAYAHAISVNLLRAARTLFGARERDMLATAQNVSLDEDELSELRQQGSD